MRTDEDVVTALIDAAAETAYVYRHPVDGATVGLMVQAALQRLAEAMAELEAEYGYPAVDGLVLAREYVERLAARGLT